MSKWEWKKLKDICEKGSSNIKQSDLKDLTGDYPIFGASGYIQNVDFYQRNRDYIGIIKDGSGVGRTMLLPAFSSVIGTLQYILPKEGNDIKFINYALQNIDFSKSVQGAAIPHIYFKDYGETEILVPPLSEQNRIVKFLDEEFSKIDTLKTNAETNLKNAKELFETTLEKELNPGKDGSFPSGWKWTALSNVCEKIFAGGDKPQNCSKDPSEILSVPVYANGVENDGLYGYTDQAAVMVPCLTISARGTIGFAVKRTEPFVPIIRLIVMIPKTDVIDLDYIFYTVKHLKIVGNGTSIPQLTVPLVKQYVIPLPPLSVQKEIVARLDKLSENVKRLEANYKQIIDNCDELKKTTLKQTFKGGN